MKRIILLGTIVAITVAMMAASSLSVSAQDYSTEQYDPALSGQSYYVCAPWSKEWDISKGQWYFEWYRWCYDSSLYDPAYESSWYKEWGDWEWADQVNLCPEKGSCTMSPDGGMKITN